MSGYGRLIFASGNIYEGEFLNNQRHGTGTFTELSDKRYEGQFENNKYHGFGRIIGANGVVHYEGQWLEGKKHGQGVVEQPDGTFRRGEWQMNERVKWFEEAFGLQGEKQSEQPKKKIIFEARSSNTFSNKFAEEFKKN